MKHLLHCLIVIFCTVHTIAAMDEAPDIHSKYIAYLQHIQYRLQLAKNNNQKKEPKEQEIQHLKQLGERLTIDLEEVILETNYAVLAIDEHILHVEQQKNN